MPDITYKLPRPFTDAMGDLLTAINWTQGGKVRVVLPDGVDVYLEVAKGRLGAVVIRPADAGSANRIRKFSDGLAAADPERYPPQSDAETERVIQMRNPKQAD